jgi:hypothetical protein
MLTQMDPAVHDRLLSSMEYCEKNSPRLDVNGAALCIAVVELHSTMRFDNFFGNCPVMLDARNSFFEEHSRLPRKTPMQLKMFVGNMNCEEGYHSLVARHLYKIINGDRG